VLVENTERDIFGALATYKIYFDQVDSSESNDTIDGALEIQREQSIPDVFLSDQDQDWYRFKTVAGEQYNVVVTPGRGSLVNAAVNIFDSATKNAQSINVDRRTQETGDGEIRVIATFEATSNQSYIKLSSADTDRVFWEERQQSYNVFVTQEPISIFLPIVAR